MNIRIKGLILLLLPLNLAMGSENLCSSYLSSNNTLKTTFLQISHDTDYDVDVSTLTIKDQCQTGHCHLYTWSAQLEHVSGIEVSNDYLDAMNIYHTALKALKDGKTKLSFASNPADSRDSILTYGLIPKNIWSPIFKPNSRKVYSKIVTGIESILLNSKLQNLNPTDIEKLILNFIQSLVGVWPTTFEYNSEWYTPNTFAEAYFSNLNQTLTTVVRVDDAPSTQFLDSNTFPKIEKAVGQIEFENLLMSVLDQGKPAYLSYNHHEQFVDAETGIMSISAFNFPAEAMIINPEIISQNYLWTGAHAVLVIGYQKDQASGRPIKWKIQNSWGSTAGDNGFFHMYSDYFQLHAWSFSFIDD